MGYVQKKNEGKRVSSCFTINSLNSAASEHSKYTVPDMTDTQTRVIDGRASRSVKNGFAFLKEVITFYLTIKDILKKIPKDEWSGCAIE